MSTFDKNILALLNGLAGRNLYGEDKYTNVLLHDEIFNDMPLDEFNSLVAKFEAILQSLVSSDMEFNQLEAYLTSQMKKKDSPLTEARASAVSKFWRANKSKVENIMINRSNWDQKLLDLNWRVDMRTQVKDISEVNTPSAILQLKLGRSSNGGNEKVLQDTVRVELDLDDLKRLTDCIEEIENCITVDMSEN